jgi:hypothetical protein
MNDEVPFEIIEDIRDWPEDLRNHVKIGKVKEERAKFTLRYKLDDAECSFSIDFTMKLKGQTEKDSPDPGIYLLKGKTEENSISVKLLSIEVHSVKIDTPDFTGTIKRFSENTLRNILNLMIKVLQPEYDVLGEKLRLISMQQN